MINLVFHSFWHGIISIITWVRTSDYRATGDSWIANLDHGAFYVFIGIFVVFHIIVIIWLYCVPLKHRKHMRQKDAQYRASALQMVKHSENSNLKKRTMKLPVIRI
jgi:hypothetical protein